MTQSLAPKTGGHTFVVSAYKESPYLEECIRSLLDQTVPGEVVIATSTPNPYIAGIAAKYEIPLFEHEGGEGIAGDWNYALSCAGTSYATVAHQDDVYLPGYREKVIKALDKSKDPLIAFTKYAELRSGREVVSNRNLRIKNLLLFPLKARYFHGSRFIRRRILSMGSAICCPSVTVNLDKVELPLFENNMKSNIDWQAWEKLSRMKGSFVYVPDILMEHRIHEDSTTTKIIGQSSRKGEDIFMFRKFWPGWIANIIEHFYIKSEESNNL